MRGRDRQATGGHMALEASWGLKGSFESFNPVPWIIAMRAAAEAVTDESGLVALLELADRLRPWLDAHKRAIGGEQDFTLIGSQSLVGEDGCLNVGA